MRDFALRLPVQVIGMLVGVPKADQASSARDLPAEPSRWLKDDLETEQLIGITEAAAWFNEYLDWRAKNPTDDVMSQLLNVEFEDETGTRRKLRREETVTYLTLITSGRQRHDRDRNQLGGFPPERPSGSAKRAGRQPRTDLQRRRGGAPL